MTINHISVDVLKLRLDTGETIHLIDVREPEENAAFNIGGMLLPLGKIQTMQMEDIEDLKNEEIVCYCRSGVRSAQAALILQAAGFTNVKNLTGGMIAWQEKQGK